MEKILIADDSVELATILFEMLVTLNDVEVLEPASDGNEALRQFKLHSPTIVILDFQMPGLNGLQVLQEIRRTNSECLVTLLTSNIEPEIRARFLAEGANHVLEKFSEYGRVPEIVAAAVSLGKPKAA